MSGFTKLFSSLVTSSIWGEPDSVRVVWVTMLALSDRFGTVEASVGGLARAANVSREACEAALAVLLAPDPDDRSGVAEGRRIEAVQGGWKIRNYLAYRERGRSADRRDYLREKQRESRARRKGAVNSVSTNVNRNQPIAEAEAEAEADSREKKGAVASLPLPGELDTGEFRKAWAEWLAYRRETRIPAWGARTVKAQLAALAKIGPEAAIAAIETSIRSGWRGIFPKDDTRRPKPSAVAAGGLDDTDRAALARKSLRYSTPAEGADA